MDFNNYFSEQNIISMNNRIAELIIRNQELEILNKDLKDKLKKTEETFQSTIIDFKKEKKELKENYEKQIKQLNDKIKEQEIKIEELNKTLKNTKKIYSKKIKEKDTKINEIENKYNEVINHFDKISIENERSKKIEDDNKNIIQRNENRKNENESLINNRARLEFLGDKANNYYDVVIEIDSINKLIKFGWKINYNEERKEIYDKIIKERTLKIGVLGVNNVGKSYILGLISKIVIPTGNNVPTNGISIKYTKGEKDCEEDICLLDSVGFEKPLLNDEIIDENGKLNEDIKYNEQNIYEHLLYLEKIKQICKDKDLTELIIENLIIALSDILILVVGKLTRREQKLIDRIKKLVRENENVQFDSIIIIHNLSEYNELIEVDYYINNILKKSDTFKLEEIKVVGMMKYKERIFYSEKDGTDHYIMANQNSNAGN